MAIPTNNCNQNSNATLTFTVIIDANFESPFVEPENPQQKTLVYRASLEDISAMERTSLGLKEDEFVFEGRLVEPQFFDPEIIQQRKCLVEFDSNFQQVIRGVGLLLPHTSSRLGLEQTFGDWVKVKVNVEI